MKYRSSIDGLRAVAILAVLLYHAMPSALQGGFTGVDVFFVLSGYLISSVILHDIRDGTFSMKDFYLRRVQRLLPNAALMVLVTVVLSFLFLLPTTAHSAAENGIWAMFNLSNIYLYRTVGSYWDDAAAWHPLLHTWSLGIEEQFYLLFPAVLYLLARRSSPLIATAALTLISLTLCITMTALHPLAAFYLLPTRAWELLFGAVLATYLIPTKADRPLKRFGPSVTIEALGWIGLVLIFCGYFFIEENASFPGVHALVPTVGSLLILITIADGDTGPARLLSKPIFVLLGKLSYSLYLWHWPMIVIGAMYADLIGQPEQIGRWVGLSLGVVFAVVAYYTVEHPLRQRGPGRRRRLLVLAGGVSVCMIVCTSLTIHHRTADPDHLFNRLVWNGSLYNVGGPDSHPLSASTRFYDVLISEPTYHANPSKDGGVVHRWGKGKPRVVVLGSSHALMYGRMIDDICKELEISVAFLSAESSAVFFPTEPNGRFPSPELARDFDEARKKWIAEWTPDTVIVIDRWDLHAGDPVQFREKLRSLVGVLSPYTQQIILFSQVPVLRLGEQVNLREFATWNYEGYGGLPKISPDIFEPVRKSSLATLETLAREFAKVKILRADSPFYNPDGSVRYLSGREFLYADDDHLSEAGAELVRDIFAQAILETRKTVKSRIANVEDPKNPQAEPTH